MIVYSCSLYTRIELILASDMWSQRSTQHACCTSKERGYTCTVDILFIHTRAHKHCYNIIMISTQENVRIEEVKLKRKYINSGDVFILDLGLRMIQVYIIPLYYRQHYTCFNER